MKDTVELLEKVKSYWDKKTGIILLIAILIYSYFQWLFPILQTNLSQLKIWNYLFSFIPVILAYCIWAFSTGRLYISTKKFTLGLIIRIDDSRNEQQIKQIIKACVEDIRNEFNDIKIIFYPVNYKKNEKEIQRHLKFRILPIDAFVVATIESGNITLKNGSNSNMIHLSKFFFAGNFDMNENVNLFNSNLSANKDLSLRFLHKSWSYIESNSYNDKKKIKRNFKDTILYFSAIYLIYKQELEISLNILKTLYQPELQNIKIENNKIILTRDQIAAFRLNHILLNLYYTTALSDYFESKCPQKAYKLLLECNKLFPLHPELYYHLIPLANFAYRCNDLKNAVRFTEQAEELKGETIDVLLNKGFFALLENDIEKFRVIYSKIAGNLIPPSYNMIDVVGFFEEHRDKLVDKSGFVDFAESAITKLFIDINEGNKLLDDFENTYNETQGFDKLIELSFSIRQNTSLRISNRTNVRSKQRSIRRKKRKRK